MKREATLKVLLKATKLRKLNCLKFELAETYVYVDENHCKLSQFVLDHPG